MTEYIPFTIFQKLFSTHFTTIGYWNEYVEVRCEIQ